MTTPRSRSPLHRELETALLERIERGEWQSGDRIPGEMELVSTYKVSRNTVRTALGSLERRGLLERHAGRGTFVKDPLTHLVWWHEDLRDEFVAQGLPPSVRVLEFTTVIGESSDARRLGIALGAPVLVVRRQLLLGSEPFGIVHHRLPRDLVPALRADDYLALYPDGLYRATGLEIRHGTLSLVVDGADDAQSKALAIPRGAPIFRYERTLTLTDGRCLELAQAILRADRACFRADFVFPDGPSRRT